MPTPNILIILADDIGVDSFRIDKDKRQIVAQVNGPTSSAGPVRLLHFERLLANGVHFESAWAHPVCTPTRASLWTGMQAWKTGLGFPSSTGNDALPDKAITGTPIVGLAQAIKAKTQYRCAMFGKWDLGGVKTPVHMGWDYFAGIFAGGLRPIVVQEYGFPPPPTRLNYERLVTATGSKKPALCASVAALLATKYDKTFLANNPDLRYYVWHKDVVESNGTVSAKQPPTARQEPYATADQVADAKKWIAAQAGSPWCVALNLIVPHDPYHLPPPGTYKTSTVKDPANPTVQEMLVAMLESMDYYLGDLLKAIDNQLANTVVIFVSDNGTQDIDSDTGTSVDHIVGDDKAHIAIGGIHVPMIIADGGRMKGGAPCYTTTAPRTVPEPVHIIDVYRTALDIAGVTSTAASDSISIAPHLTGTGTKRAHNFSQMYVEPVLDPDGITARTPGTSAAVSDAKYKMNCFTMTAGPGQDTYLVDAQGAKTKTPVYTYQFTCLNPEAGVVGSLVETPLPVLAPNPDKSFTITDLAYQEKLIELYTALDRERPKDDPNSRFPIIKKSPFVFPATLLDKPVLIENLETKRYLFSDGDVFSGNRGAEGGWLSSPSVVGADANYYNRALWIIRKQGECYLIENQETHRYLFSTGAELTGAREAEGGWLSSSGFESPKLVGTDANYYNLAFWVFQPQGDAFLIANLQTKRYAFSDGPNIPGNRGAEGGWLASSGFASPKVVGADANYYNRALWRIHQP